MDRDRPVVTCPFCNEPIQPADTRNYAYVRTKFVLHFEACAKRPADLTKEHEDALAERLYEEIAREDF